MNKIRIILGYLLSFIMSILITILVLTLIIKFTISDKSYVVKIMEDNNYYKLVSDEIMEEIMDTITSSGFNDDILHDLYTEDMVKEDILLFINNMYEGKKTELNKESIKNKLDENINEFLKKNNIDVINKDDIIPFENDIKEIYENEITLYKMADSVAPIIGKMKLINNVVIGLSVSIGILFILLIVIHQAKFWGSIILASGLIILFLYIAVYDNIDVNNLLVITEKFSKVLIVIIRNLGSICLKIGLLTSIIGIILSLTLSCKEREK